MVPGAILMIALVLLVPSLPPLWIVFPALSVLFFTAPAMRAAKVPPILTRCPQCLQKFGAGCLQAHMTGTILTCSECGQVSYLPCSWGESEGRAVPVFDGPIEAAMYTEDGEILGWKRARWPYFYVSWKPEPTEKETPTLQALKQFMGLDTAARRALLTGKQ